MRRVAALFVAVLMIALGCTDGDDAPDDAANDERSTTSLDDTAGERTVNNVDWGGCEFEVPPGVDLDCGTLEVPADRGEPDADTVTLAVAIVRTDHDDPADDPIVYLSGGPGQGALELVPMAFGQTYEPLAQNRDLILVDQRGTGLSEPSLMCDEYSSWVAESLGSDRPLDELKEQADAALGECRQRLADDGVDLSHYNSAASAADLEDLRVSLDYDEWNLYGISYGTRLAQTAMRDHPDSIRSVVLDSAYPINANLYEEVPANATRAMEALFDLCGSDPACQERFGDLEQTFTSLVARSDEEPMPIVVPQLASGTRVESEVDGSALVGLLFQSLYATDLIAFLPETIDQAADGEVGTVGLLLGVFAQQLDLVSVGMHLGVQCQEEVPFSDPGAIEEAADEHELVSGFFENSGTFGRGIIDICEQWGAGEPGADEDEPIDSDIPTLLLAGELDPITPPRWGEELADHLSNSIMFTFPYTGHGAVGAQPCAATIAAAFVDDPDASPDDACIDDIEPPDFTGASIDIEMVPYTSEQFGFAGVRPDAWTEGPNGGFQQSLLVSLLQQAPGMTAEQLLQVVTNQLGADAPPEPVGQHETEFLTWDLYELRDFGQRIDLALAEHEGRLWVVQLVSTAERRDVYRDQVFVPAIESFDPGQ